MYDGAQSLNRAEQRRWDSKRAKSVCKGSIKLQGGSEQVRTGQGRARIAEAIATCEQMGVENRSVQ